MITQFSQCCRMVRKLECGWNSLTEVFCGTQATFYCAATLVCFSCFTFYLSHAAYVTLYFSRYFFIWQECKLTVLASAPLHTQDTEIGLGALVWQPQPSFSISDRSCLMAEKSRQNASRIARQKMKTGCERHGERESERRREDRATKLGRTRKTIRCYQSEQ